MLLEERVYEGMAYLESFPDTPIAQSIKIKWIYNAKLPFDCITDIFNPPTMKNTFEVRDIIKK